MKLNEISEVRLAYDEAVVNKSLKEKFKIIKILQSKSNGDADIMQPVFVLAK